MNPYQRHAPKHIKEAVDMITNLEDAYYVAHGTKLLPLIGQEKLIAKHLISLDNINDLKNITKLNGVRLGSGLTFSQIEQSDIVKQQFTALYDAICALPLSRRKDEGTLGGDLCSAYPFAAMACPMLLFDTEIAAAGMYPATHSSGMGVKGGFFGSRIIRIDSFFTTLNTTILKRDELVKEFILPFLPDQTGSAFIRIKKNNAAQLGIAGIGARISLSTKGNIVASKEAAAGKSDLAGILNKFADDGLECMDVRLAVVYPRSLPQRLRLGEDAFKGQVLTAAVFENAILAAANEVVVSTQGKHEPWYREEVVRMLLKRSVMKAIDRALWPEREIQPESAW